MATIADQYRERDEGMGQSFGSTSSLVRPSVDSDIWGGVAAGSGALWNTWGGLWADPQPRTGTALVIHPETGEYIDAPYEWFQDEGLLPAGMTRYEWDMMKANGEFQPLVQNWWDSSQSGGGGGGGGGGAAGPVYVKPDERAVRENVKAMLAALAGTVDEAKLNELTKLYMDEHARSFALRESEQLDPMESVKAAIRSTSEYKTIHKLRPESTDEYTWITQRQGALTRAGVSDMTAESLGVAQATVGASTQEATTAGNVAAFNQSGQQLDELKNRIRGAAYGALRLA